MPNDDIFSCISRYYEDNQTEIYKNKKFVVHKENNFDVLLFPTPDQIKQDASIKTITSTVKSWLKPGNANCQYTQVIGSSSGFSEADNSIIDACFRTHLGQVVFYGVTGEETGVNAKLIQFIKNQKKHNQENDPNFNRTVIGNIVYPAMQQRGKAPDSNVCHHFIVVGSKDTPATYGDDINISDGCASKVIVIDGGLQTLTQAINTLKIHAEKAKIILCIPTHKQQFSAAALIKRMKAARKIDDIPLIVNTYFKKISLNDDTKRQQCNKICSEINQKILNLLRKNTIEFISATTKQHTRVFKSNSDPLQWMSRQDKTDKTFYNRRLSC